MIVVNAARIAEFARRHPDARGALATWLRLTEGAVWKSLVEVRRTFPHADGVKLDDGRVVTVFNIRGNNYRLIASVNYGTGVVSVGSVLTHAEYDKGKWRNTP